MSASHVVRQPPNTPLRIRTSRWPYPHFNLELPPEAPMQLVRRRVPPGQRLGEWTDAFAALPDTDYDLIHTLNAIPLWPRHRPFITTFEDVLPRVPEDRPTLVPRRWLLEWLRRELLAPRCRALVALSDFAVRQFCAQNQDWPELPHALAKVRVMRPHVALRRQTPKPGHAHPDALRLF